MRGFEGANDLSLVETQNLEMGLYEAAGRRLDGAKYGNTPHDADASPHMGQKCYGDQHEASNQLALKRRVESCSRKPLFYFSGDRQSKQDP
jgi:hypothetical protein